MTVLDRLLTQVGNLLLDWTLLWPRDLTLLLLAVLTITLLLGLRWLLADRDALHLLAADEQRLRELRADARAAGKRAAPQQHRRVRRLLAVRRAQLEMVPALAGLLPALLVLHWGARRLEYLPLTTNEPFGIEATFPAAAVGQPAHLVPRKSLSVEPTWIRMIAPSAGAEARGAEARGAADWRVVANSPGEITLTLRHPAGSVSIPLRIGPGSYEPPIIAHESGVTSEVKLSRYRPLGVVPPVPWLGLPAWMVGLLLLTVPGYLLVRRALRIP